MNYFWTCVLVAVCAATRLSAQAKLEFVGGDSYDWGTVYAVEKTLEKKVEIKNAGDKELYIDLVKPACGCTTAPLEKKRLQPGESTFMDVKLGIKGSTGAVARVIYLYSNSLPNSTQPYILRVNVVHPLQSTPAYVTIPQILAGGSTAASVKLKNNVATPITVTSIEPNHNSLAVSSAKPRVIQPGEEIDVPMKVTLPKEATGAFNGAFTVKTDYAEQKELTINVYGTIRNAPMKPGKAAKTKTKAKTQKK